MRGRAHRMAVRNGPVRPCVPGEVARNDTVLIFSFNLHGLGQGQFLLQDLCNRVAPPGIIMLQEHWLTAENLFKLNVSPNYTVFGGSAMDKATSNAVIRGRPYGGVPTFVHNDFASAAKCIIIHERFIIVKLGRTLFVNIYFPCSTHLAVNYDVLCVTLDELGRGLAEYPDHNIVMAGDMNTDLRLSSRGTDAIRKFTVDTNLLITTDRLVLDYDRTYFSDVLGHSSMLDFFIVSPSLFCDLVGITVCDDSSNLSDHFPVALTIKSRAVMKDMPIVSVANDPEPVRDKRLRWDKANLSNYYNLSNIVLTNTLTVLDDFYARIAHEADIDPAHGPYRGGPLSALRLDAITLIEGIYSGLAAALYDTADQVIPKMAQGTLKSWWNAELYALKHNTILSHEAWCSAGKPQNGALFLAKKHDKYAYKLAIRKCKNASTNKINDSLLKALNKSTDFWKLWKAKLGTPKTLPCSVGGKTNQADIAEDFAQYFANICTYNSDARNLELENEFTARKNNFHNDTNVPNYRLSVEMVDRAIKKLKLGKAIGADRISAEHLLYAHPILVIILTKLFNLLLFFEYVPNGFGIGVLIPIPKSDKDLDRTDNYRGITLNPVISKVFEHCLLTLFSNFLHTSPRQFGFKAKTGCDKALYTVRKTIDYFVEREATVNACALDMAKAFDKMNKNALFIKLLNNKCPLTFINILHCWYSKAFACVKWGAALSSLVQMKSGTRQGGVCSPALFAVFINDVLTHLEKSGLGCFINHYCLNSFMFADDLVLLTISISDLNDMIAICKVELDWLDMKVNVLKSDCIRVGPRYNITHCIILLGQDRINWSDEIKYLGLLLVVGKRFACNLHNCKLKFFRALNSILSKIGDMSALSVILSLTDSNCTPILMYGLEAMHLTKAQTNRLIYAYNSVFYKLFRTFHSETILQTQFYTGHLNLESFIDLRTINFLNNLRTFDFYSPASYLFNLCGTNEWSCIASKYNISVNDAGGQCRIKIWAAFASVVAALP